MVKNRTTQEKLTGELINYVKMRLAMSLFPVRRALLNLDREELSELVRQQSVDIGQGIQDLVEHYFPTN